MKRLRTLVEITSPSSAAASEPAALLAAHILPIAREELSGDDPLLIQSPPISGKGESLTILTTAAFATIGLASIAGGWVGYKKANSRPSLIAGTASGLSLVAAAALTAVGNVAVGVFIGGVTCVALAGRFIPAYLRTRQVMPAGVMSVLAGCGVLAALIGFLSR